MAKTESNEASGAAQIGLDNVERYVNAAVGPRLSDGSDPIEAAIRDQQRSVEREYFIARHEALSWSFENAPRLEAERKLSQLKLLGIADDDPRCQMQRLRADGYPESDPRVQLARLRAEGVPEDHPLVKQLSGKADLSPATVVTMWLSPAINEELAPKLRRQLKPGARIVSHQFRMGTWLADEQVTVDDEQVFLWRLPAKRDE